jgi:hypothetical protein
VHEAQLVAGLSGDTDRGSRAEQHARFPGLHDLGLSLGQMVHALRMQRPMDDQVRIVRQQLRALSRRLAAQHRAAEHDVGDDGRRRRVVEGEDVGRMVLAAELAVQRPAPRLVDDSQRDLAPAARGGRQPASQAVAR